MKMLLLLFPLVCVLACGHQKKVPDVSNIKVNLQTIRFENDFFAVDTNHIDGSLQKLYQRYPGFTQDFLFNILGTTPNTDSASRDVKLFTRTYKGIYDSAHLLFADISGTEKEIKKGMQLVKYYFPSYKLPGQLITFVGPINSFSSIITPDALLVGLQLYMGRHYSVYNSDEGKEMYPEYVSRRFEKEYIPVNGMRSIIDDMYPLHQVGKPLIEQMIELGKRVYVLDALLPETPDTLTTGYTENQLDFCYSNEKMIWTFFTGSDLLYQADLSTIGSYINDGPNTSDMGPASPGNIGQFVGWQIVKKWMEKNDKASLITLMKTPAKQILEESKYKPR